MSNPDAVRKTFAKVLSASESMLARMGQDYETVYRMCCNALVTSQIRARGRQGMATLGDCSTDSVSLALIKTLNASLVPDGEEVALVPLRRGSDVECEAWVGIVGKLKLARRATKGLAIEARTVYADDHFDFAFGLEPRLEHRPSETGSRDEAQIRAVYAIARMPGSAPEVEVWFRPDIDRYRAMSRAKRGPWTSGHYAEMAERGPLGSLLKRLPKRMTDLVDPERVPFVDEPAPAPAIPAPSAPAPAPEIPAPTAPAPAPAPEIPATDRAISAPQSGDSPPIEAYEAHNDDPFA